MKSRLGIQILLVFLAFAIGCFDKHPGLYFHGETNLITACDNLPAHTDLLVKSCDYQEDITLKKVICAIPEPSVFLVRNYRDFRICFPRISPTVLWQPPEKTV